MLSVGVISKVCCGLLGDKLAVDDDFSLFGWLLVGEVLDLRFAVNGSLFGLYGFDGCFSVYEKSVEKISKVF